MNAAKAKFAKNQIVQKFGLAQSRIGWRRGDCMNRLVCRRRIGVIHLHRDDRCCPLSDIYSLSRARLTRERPAKAIPSIISDRQILSPASQYDVGTSLSLKTNVNVTAASVSPTLRLCSWQPQWFGRDPGSACIYIYNKEGSISDDEEEDVCFKRPSIQAYFHLNIKSRSNTVPSMLINISCWSLLEEEILMLMENLMCLWWSAM